MDVLPFFAGHPSRVGIVGPGPRPCRAALHRCGCKGGALGGAAELPPGEVLPSNLGADRGAAVSGGQGAHSLLSTSYAPLL
eukprot:1158492-Pelagomonas_calceolata.AAC.2